MNDGHSYYTHTHQRILPNLVVTTFLNPIQVKLF